MAFIKYRGALEEVDETSYWHLASPDGVGFFYHNLYCCKGILHSVSYMIEIDPNLASAVTPYSLLNTEVEKEAVFEKIRAENYSSLPSRLKALFVLRTKADVERVLSTWFINETRTPHEAWLLGHSVTHVGDSIWLDSMDLESAARSYWSGQLTETPLMEVIVHGTLYFPGWEKFAKLHKST